MTYFIEVNEAAPQGSQERQGYLRLQAGKHCMSSTTVIIIQVGSNEISQLDISLPLPDLQDPLKESL